MKKLLSLALGTMFLVASSFGNLVFANGIEDACDSTCPLVWNQALLDQSVQCAEDLPTSCDDYLNFSGIENLSAINACSSEAFPVFACFPLASESISAPVSSCLATTAKRNGELAADEYAPNDGAIRLYGLSAMGMADSDYFVEDPSNPLQFLHAPDSRSARLTGTVHCVANENQIFHVDARFVNEDNAMEWLAESDAHTLLIGDDPQQNGYQTCDIDTAGITVFDLQALSRLEGDGDLEGTLFIDHMPMSYSKRFQLGLGANNHNCNEGFGGWFRWEGMLNGQSVQGLSGDVVLDLECSSPDTDCSQYASFLFESIDDCGRILSTSVLVDRQDTEAPVVISGPESLTVECDMIPEMAPASSIEAEDNCEGDLNVSEGVETRFDGDCPNHYVLNRRWTVTDLCGNATTHVQNVEVQDTTNPVVSGENLVLVSCDAFAPDEAFATATDNCGMVSLSWTDLDQSGGCVLPIGQFSRTYTATDDCGNASTFEQIITLTDSQAPEFDSVPADASYECDEAIVYEMAMASDNCSGASVTVVADTVFSELCMQTFTITRTFTAVDNCDNSASAVQVIEVADTTAPSLEIPADYEAECSAAHPLEAATASDNCGPVTIVLTADTVAGACAQSYVVTRTFVATDACGNSTSDAQVITIVDTQAPMFVEELPASLEVECDNVPDGAVLTAMDNCQDVSVSYSETRLDGSCPSNYTLTRTWTSSDDCGNEVTHEQIVGVSDTTSPEFTFVPADYTAECDEEHPMEMATGMDVCSDFEIGVTEVVSYDCPQGYTIERTFEAVDACGNSASAMQTITIVDSTSPVIDASAEVFVECNDYPTEEFFATATDNCSEVSLTFEDAMASGGCVLPFGMVVRTYTATDDCGNASTFEQIITLTDSQAPEFDSVPADASYECDEAIVYEMAMASDNCSGASVTVVADTVFSELCMQTFTITRTFTAVDNCDNSASAVQVIEVADTTAPSLEIPADYEAECSAAHPLEAATASDNCGPVTIVLTADTVAGACAQSYVVTRTFVATDACGNSTSDAQVITIVDTQAPMFVEELPASLEVECDNVPDGAVLTAMDNCQDVSVSYSETRLDGSCPSNYTLTRTWTSSDDCGNEVTHEQIVGVSDTTSPEFTFVPADYTAECDEEHPMEMATGMDVCSDFEIGVTEVVSYDCPQGYTIERTFEAVDACGNSASAMQTITIVDSTSPVIDAIEVVMIPCAEYDPEVGFATATDNCGLVSLTWEDQQTSGGCALPIGQYVRVYTAVDECGNVGTTDQVLTLVDDTDPEFTFVPEDYTAECIDALTYEEAEATDNCSGVTMTISVDTMSTECEGTFDIVRTWVATDNCNNAATAVQVISVVDEEGPYFTFVPEDYTAECSDDLVLEMAEAVDHCSSFEIVVQTDTLEGPCSGQYVILREFIATDACGNASETTQIIFVEDTTAPVFSFVPEDYTAECSDDQPMLDAEAMDACGMVDIVLDESTDYNGCLASYTLTRVWTATDDCGNSASASQTITIEDTTAPVFEMVPESYALECLSEPVYDEVVVSDNCSAVELSLLVDTVFSDCENVYDIVRSWTASDLCGNASAVSQTISIVDTTAPQLTSTCGLMNHEVVEVCCETLDGTLTIPAACDVQFTDNCGGEASVELVETYSGAFAPTSEIDRYCVISDPQALANGETCDGDAPTSMELLNFPGSNAYVTLNGAVAHMMDGTMTYTMEVVAIDNPNAGWTVEAHYSAPMDWEAWTDQPGTHSYKSDCGLGDHTAWDYAMMTSGFAEGWGEYEGDSFQMMHQPANGYFGFQIGEGANNKNSNYGFSGWFYLSGTVGGQNVMASGDLFGELDCCQPWTLERQYTVTDCVGNATSFSYEIQVTGASCNATEEGGIAEGEDATPVSFKDVIEVVSLQPNPASTQVNLTLLSEEVGTDVRVELHASTGAVVMTLFNGLLVEGAATPIDFNVASLNAGMYQLRVTAKNFVSTKKLLVID